MRKTLVRSGILGLIVALSMPVTAGATDLPFTVRSEKLPNGLQLVMVPQPGNGLIAYYSLVRVGSRDETEQGVTGFAHFFEHMMFRGTKNWKPERVKEFLKKTGADQNGFTTDDFTCYTFMGRSNDLEGLVDMEADRFQNLEYTEDVFKTESKAVLGEYNKSSSSPSLPLRERLREKVYTQHTYGHTTLGYLKDIEDMPNQMAYSKTFFDRFYTPDNTVIIAVGDFDPSKLSKLVKAKYSGWTKKRADSKVKPEPKQKKAVREHIDWPTPTLPMLSMSWRTPKSEFGSKDTAVYELIYELIFGKTTPLYKRLVLEEQVVQRFSDWNWHHKDPYMFHVLAYGKSQPVLQKVEKAVKAEIARLASGKVDEKRLEAVKSHVRYKVVLDLVTPSSVAVAIAYTMGAGGDVSGLEAHLETISEVNVDDIERFARLYLSDDNSAVVTLATKGGK